jgi:hypothetical protein
MFQWELSSLNKAIVQGLCGAVAPELVDWITSNIRRKLGYKDKQRTPAWKGLFKRKKKPKRRRRAAAKKAAPGKTKPKKGAAKPVAKKQPAGKAPEKKPKAPKPSAPKPDDGQATLNL